MTTRTSAYVAVLLLMASTARSQQQQPVPSPPPPSAQPTTQPGIDPHLAKARALRSQQKLAEAAVEMRLAVQDGEKLAPTRPLLNAALFELGQILYLDRKYAEAEPVLVRATTTAPAANVNASVQASQWYWLGITIMAAGRAVEAEAPLRTAIRLESTVDTLPPGAVGSSQLRLAAVMETKGEFDEAESLYREALRKRESRLAADNGLVGEALNSLGEFLRLRRSRYVEAEPLLRRSLAIAEKQDAASPRVGVLSNNLALALTSQGKLDEAEALFLRAIDIGEHSDTAEGAAASRALGNLASLYLRREQYPEAARMAERALATRERMFGADSINITPELRDVISVYRAQNRAAEAEPLARRVLAIDEKALGPDHPSVATDRLGLADVLTMRKQFADSVPLYQAALATIEKRNGPSSAVLGQSLQRVGIGYRLAGR